MTIVENNANRLRIFDFMDMLLYDIIDTYVKHHVLTLPYAVVFLLFEQTFIY